VHLRDSTAIEDELVSVEDSSITLLGDLIPAPELGERCFRRVFRTLSIPKIQNVAIQVKVPGNATTLEKYAAGILGSVLGFAAGSELGSLTVTHHTGFAAIGDIGPEIAAVLLGGTLGAGLGAYFGVSIVNHTRTMELTLDPNCHEQCDSLKAFARDYKK
jgi:hypothetical protein